jgi:large subunit ribosomal protein L1
MAPLLSSFNQQVRGAKSNPQAQGKKAKAKSKKEKKGPREFKQKDLKDVEQFALCDAVR